MVVAVRDSAVERHSFRGCAAERERVHAQLTGQDSE
jgi:hypothetical protein